MIVFLVRVCCDLYHVSIHLMRTKGESRKSPQKPALPSRIEFSILGPNWSDDTYFEGIRIKTTPSPEKLPSPSQQEVVMHEEAMDSVSSSNEGSPENSIVGGWMALHSRRRKKRPNRTRGCRRRGPAQSGFASPAERRKRHAGTNHAFSVIDRFFCMMTVMPRGTSSATLAPFG